MRGRERLWATIVMWVMAMGVLGGFLLTLTFPSASYLSGNVILGIVVSIAAAAGLGTYGVWHGAGPESGETAQGRAQSFQQPAKSKRASADRLERLMMDLSDDEVYELESLLVAREERLGR